MLFQQTASVLPNELANVNSPIESSLRFVLNEQQWICS